MSTKNRNQNARNKNEKNQNMFRERSEDELENLKRLREKFKSTVKKGHKFDQRRIDREDPTNNETMNKNK